MIAFKSGLYRTGPVDIEWNDPTYKRIPSEYHIRGYRVSVEAKKDEKWLNLKVREKGGDSVYLLQKEYLFILLQTTTKNSFY